MYKFVPDALSLEESPSNSNTSFHRQKGCLRQTVSYTHTPTHILTDIYMCVYTERERYAQAAVGAFVQSLRH